MTEGPAESAKVDERELLAFPFRPEAPLASASLAAGKRPAFHLVDVTGKDRAYVEALIPTATAALAELGLIPVFVSASLDLDPFRAEGALVEVVPDVAACTGLDPTLDWTRYRSERLKAIARKWGARGMSQLSPDGLVSDPS
jgi:hypothetical protein